MECKIKNQYRKEKFISNDKSIEYTKYYDTISGKLLKEKIEKPGMSISFKINHLNIAEEITGTNVKTGEKFIISYGSNHKPYVYKVGNNEYDIHKDGNFVEEMKEIRDKTRRLLVQEGKIYKK